MLEHCEVFEDGRRLRMFDTNRLLNDCERQVLHTRRFLVTTSLPIQRAEVVHQRRVALVRGAGLLFGHVECLKQLSFGFKWFTVRESDIRESTECVRPDVPDIERPPRRNQTADRRQGVSVVRFGTGRNRDASTGSPRDTAGPRWHRSRRFAIPVRTAKAPAWRSDPTSATCRLAASQSRCLTN